MAVHYPGAQPAPPINPPDGRLPRSLFTSTLVPAASALRLDLTPLAPRHFVLCPSCWMACPTRNRRHVMVVEAMHTAATLGREA